MLRAGLAGQKFPLNPSKIGAAPSALRSAAHGGPRGVKNAAAHNTPSGTWQPAA